MMHTARDWWRRLGPCELSMTIVEMIQLDTLEAAAKLCDADAKGRGWHESTQEAEALGEAIRKLKPEGAYEIDWGSEDS